MRKGITRLSVLCAGFALSAACTVHQDPTQVLTGPSEFATIIRVTATPDTINQDGASQSQILVTAIDDTGKPKQNVALRLDMMVGVVLVDFGTLSARNVVTGSDGKANVVFTAPPAPPPGAGGSGTLVSILAIPIGFDAQVSLNNGAFADIRLMPPGVILPPAGTPTAEFTFSPTPAAANVDLIFDASASKVGSGATAITLYSWSFGDGDDASDTVPTETHRYAAPGTYSVTLTVTNDRGLSASKTQSVTVGTVTAPSADFVFSPTAPTDGDTVYFNAAASTAAAGRTLVSFAWDFLDGTTATGKTPTHVFTAGAWDVTLTVTDDTGQQDTATKRVTVLP